MVVVRIEIWPDGEEAKKEEIGQIHIINDQASEDINKGNYEIELWDRKPGSKTLFRWKKAHLKNFKRGQLGIFDLILRSLAVAIGYRSRG